jgi:hypothetical protein
VAPSAATGTSTAARATSSPSILSCSGSMEEMTGPSTRCDTHTDEICPLWEHEVVKWVQNTFDS